MSNKTQKAKGAKTESAPKNSSRYGLISSRWVGVTVASIILIFCVAILGRQSKAPAQPSIHIGSGTFAYETADTELKREQGLSNRTNLALDSGMLFTFENEGAYCFWMKDMRFPLDIIWLDSTKKVVFLKENLAPDTYPNTFCPSTENARYVLEINSGSAKKSNINLGSQASF